MNHVSHHLHITGAALNPKQPRTLQQPTTRVNEHLPVSPIQFSGKKLNFWSGVTLLSAALGSFVGNYGMNHWTQSGQARTALNTQVETIQTLQSLTETKKGSPREGDYQALLQKELADTVYLMDQSINVANGRPSVKPEQYWKQLGLKVDELLFTQDLLSNAKDISSIKDIEALYDRWADRVLVKVVQGPEHTEAKKTEAKAFFKAIEHQQNWHLGLMATMLAGLGLGAPLTLYSLLQKKQPTGNATAAEPKAEPTPEAGS